MTWETVPMRGASVSVSWRKPGGLGARFQLAITVASGVCAAMGLRPGLRVVPQRDRVAGKMRLLVTDQDVDGARRPTWKRSKRAEVAAIFVPMPDVRLDTQKPAQNVAHEVAPGELIIRLPHWACPLVRVSQNTAPAHWSADA